MTVHSTGWIRLVKINLCLWALLSQSAIAIALPSSGPIEKDLEANFYSSSVGTLGFKTVNQVSDKQPSPNPLVIAQQMQAYQAEAPRLFGSADPTIVSTELPACSDQIECFTPSVQMDSYDWTWRFSLPPGVKMYQDSLRYSDPFSGQVEKVSASEISGKGGEQLDTFSATRKWLWEGEVRVKTPIDKKIIFQVCTETVCFAPYEAHAKASQIILRPWDAAGTSNGGVGSSSESRTRLGSDILAREVGAGGTLGQRAYGAVKSQWDEWMQSLTGLALAAFVLGLLGALSPCMYPMLPITVMRLKKHHQINGQRTTIKVLATWFGALVVGMAVLLGTSSVLGFNSALVLQNPWVAALSAIILMSLGFLSIRPLVGFGQTIFNRQNNSSINQKKSNITNTISVWMARHEYVQTFVWATASLWVSAACMAPLLALSVSAMAALGTVSGLPGLWALGLYCMVFAAGFMLPLGLLMFGFGRLPKSGNWLFIVKAIPITLCFMSAFYLIFSQGALTTSLVEQLLVVTLVALGAFWWSRGVSWGAFIAVLGVLVIGIQGATFGKSQDSHIDQTISVAQWDAVLTDKERVLVDVWASWCTLCKEVDEVVEGQKNLLTEHKVQVIRLDITKMGPQERAFLKSNQLLGPPALMWVSKGQLTNTSWQGVISSDVLLQNTKTAFPLNPVNQESGHGPNAIQTKTANATGIGQLSGQ